MSSFQGSTSFEGTSLAHLDRPEKRLLAPIAPLGDISRGVPISRGIVMLMIQCSLFLSEAEFIAGKRSPISAFPIHWVILFERSTIAKWLDKRKGRWKGCQRKLDAKTTRKKMDRKEKQPQFVRDEHMLAIGRWV